MNSSLKANLKAKLSKNQMSVLKFFYNSLRSPKNIRKHLNRMRFDKGVLHNSVVDFVPPVFVATITDECNLRCSTCLYVLRNPGKFTRRYLDPDKYCGILERYSKKKAAEIIFLTGGEPLLHPQFDEIVDISRMFNASVKTSTNGILVQDRLFSLVKLDYVNVSVDSYDYHSYKIWRGGTRAQFDRVIEGLKALKEKELYFSMSYILSNETLSGAGRLLELAEKIRKGADDACIF